MEIEIYNSNDVSISHSSDFMDSRLYSQIMDIGFKHIDFQQVTDSGLIYLFLHDEPNLAKPRSIKTKKLYLHDLSHFMRYVIETTGTLATLHPEDVKRYFVFLLQEYKPSTIRRKKNIIKQFLNYIIRKKVVSADVVSEIQKVSIDKEELVDRAFYQEEVEQLLQHFKKINTFMYTMLYTLVSTGMRIMELSSAKWSNLKYHAKYDAYLLTITGKRQKVREVRIFEDVLEAVKEVRSLRLLNTELSPLDDTAFLPKADGTHYRSDYLGTYFTEQILKTEFPFVIGRKDPITPHTCRHFTAAHLAEKGIDIKTISDFLGHENITTTQIYLRESTRRDNLATLKFGKKMLSF